MKPKRHTQIFSNKFGLLGPGPATMVLVRSPAQLWQSPGKQILR